MASSKNSLDTTVNEFYTGGVVKSGDIHVHGGPVDPCSIEQHLKKALSQSLTPQERFNADVSEILEEIAALLEEKNRKYGDSALNPSRIFARSDAVEQIKVRMDDKLNRIRNAQDDEDEDVVKDLIGYLIILRIAQKRAK